MTDIPATLDDALALGRGAVREIVNVDEPSFKVVVFEVGGECFALRGGSVAEILPYGGVFPVPGCPAEIEGAINVRGDIESVLRLGAMLGLQDAPAGRHTSILLAHTNAMRSGLRVEQVLDVMDVAEKVIEPPPAVVPEAIRQVATGTFRYRDRACTLLDADLLFQRFGGGPEPEG